MNAHLPILPVLIPVLSAAVMVALSRQDLVLARVLSFIAAAAQLVVASLLFAAVGEGEVLVYRLGDWPAVIRGAWAVTSRGCNSAGKPCCSALLPPCKRFSRKPC